LRRRYIAWPLPVVMVVSPIHCTAAFSGCWVASTLYARFQGSWLRHQYTARPFPGVVVASPVYCMPTCSGRGCVASTLYSRFQWSWLRHQYTVLPFPGVVVESPVYWMPASSGRSCLFVLSNFSLTWSLGITTFKCYRTGGGPRAGFDQPLP
jgi:hypothetical protein